VLCGALPFLFSQGLFAQTDEPEPPADAVEEEGEGGLEEQAPSEAPSSESGVEAPVAPAEEPPPAEPPPTDESEPTPPVGTPAQEPAEVPLAEPVQIPVVEPAVVERRFEERLVLDTGRTPVSPGVKGEMRAQVHGEYQLRLTKMSDLPLLPTTSNPSTSLGQTTRLYHWLRVTPRLQFGESFEVVGQFDFPRGMLAGQPTQAVGQAEEPLDEREWYRFMPRWLYLEKRASYGLWRIGQQGSHWGMGLVANDGDHPPLFGDYQSGDIVERILFATRPFGSSSPFVVGVAGDLVFRDEQAKLVDGDRAFQGVLSLAYDQGGNQLGVYGVYRNQRRDREAVDALTPFTEKLDVFVIDLAGKFSTEIPGLNAYAFGQFEVAMITGETNVIRTVDQTKNGELEKVRSYGGAARLGRYIAKHQASTLLNLRSASRAVEGGGPGPEGAMAKLILSENGHEAAAIFTELAGSDRAYMDGAGMMSNLLVLMHRAMSIAGGTSEIKRNQIGERILGLPRDPLIK